MIQADKGEKTWNVEVFIKAVHELQTTLTWKEIIYELDHPSFIVSTATLNTQFTNSWTKSAALPP